MDGIQIVGGIVAVLVANAFVTQYRIGKLVAGQDQTLISMKEISKSVRKMARSIERK